MVALMNDENPDLAALHARSAARLGLTGALARAFSRVPRHRFIPDLVWPDLTGAPLSRSEDPVPWARCVYQDQAVTTQVNDGVPGGPGRVNRPTVSSSQPSVMAAMLQAAEVVPGAHVLEVGSGTGFNSALLSELVGAEGSVTTIEVDPGVAERAEACLRGTGHDVRVVSGDGADGYPDGAPYDALLATCPVVRVPTPWLTQVRPGGRIVLPWKPGAFLPGGMLARLVVDGSGAARGRFVGGTAFMLMRAQRPSGGMHGHDAEPDEVRVVGEDPCRIITEGSSGPQMALTVPAWRYAPLPPVDGVERVWVSATDCSAWARLRGDGRVEQGGPRRLWDEFERAHRVWVEQGRPPFTSYGLTITAGGEQRVWLEPE